MYYCDLLSSVQIKSLYPSLYLSGPTLALVKLPSFYVKKTLCKTVHSLVDITLNNDILQEKFIRFITAQRKFSGQVLHSSLLLQSSFVALSAGRYSLKVIQTEGTSYTVVHA